MTKKLNMILILIIKTIPTERRERWLKNFKKRTRLARRLHFNFYANLIEFIKNIIFSKTFFENYRTSPKDFSRRRKLSFPILILFLINFRKGSYQDELDGFFKVINHEDNFIRFVTDAAICKARHKVKFEAFIELNRSTTTFFYKNSPHQTWNGLNLIGVDGSTAKLPKEDVISEHFGCLKPHTGDSVPMARISQMFDVLNKITIDAIIAPIHIGERDLAIQHILNLTSKDLLLLDRGYPAFWLFKLICSQKSNFCARVPYNTWKITKKFLYSGKYDKITTFSPSPAAVVKCKELGLDISPLKLRMIRVDLENGTTEILITNLLDEEKYPSDIFGELYFLRWPVEEDYKCMKRRIEIERFSGKSILSVFQDFHSKVFAKNLTSILAYTVKDEIDQRYKKRKFPQQINFTQALSKMKDNIVLLFQRAEDVVSKIIMSLREIFIVTVEPVRKGRKFPRNHKIGGKEFYPNCKQIR